MSQTKKDASCKGCGAAIHAGKTGYCCHCWPQVASERGVAARQKYPWKPEWDATLRAGYAACVVGKPTKAITKIVEMTGYPRSIVKLRAARLGITRDFRRPWALAEIDYLREHAGRMSAKAMAKALGRSWESVQARMEVEKISSRITAGYSITQLADVMGVGDGRVREWLDRGWLKLDRNHRIPEARVRHLLRERLAHIDLRLCRQAWLKQVLERMFAGQGAGHTAQGTGPRAQGTEKPPVEESEDAWRGSFGSTGPMHRMSSAAPGW